MFKKKSLSHLKGPYFNNGNRQIMLLIHSEFLPLSVISLLKQYKENADTNIRELPTQYNTILFTCVAKSQEDRLQDNFRNSVALVGKATIFKDFFIFMIKCSLFLLILFLITLSIFIKACNYCINKIF